MAQTVDDGPGQADQRTPRKVILDLVPRSLLHSGDVPRRGEPVTVGLPCPQSFVQSDEALSLRELDGTEVPLQSRVLERWPDGSVRWVLLDFQTGVVVSPTQYELSTTGARQTTPPHAIEIAAEADVLTVHTGRATFRLRPGASFPLDVVTAHGAAAIEPARTRLDVSIPAAPGAEVRITAVRVEEAGPLRSVVRFEGAVFSGTRSVLAIVGRAHFFAGSATVRFALTLRNERKAEHPGGYWDLGGATSVCLRDVSLVFALPPAEGQTTVRCSPEQGSAFSQVATPFELYQDSSGGEHWRSSNHVTAAGTVPTRFRGYRQRDGHDTREGLRATPILSLKRGTLELVVAVPQFWQNFPKTLESSADAIVFRLFPQQFAELHELQAGEQKTHTFFVAFGTDSVTSEPLEWCRSPLFVRAEPAWYCGSAAVPYLLPASEAARDEYDRLVISALEGEDTFEAKREVIDEYGWRNFGDIYADHETAFHTDAVPLVSHYNNQYDAVAGCAVQFFRTGDPRWRSQMEDLAAHVKDIDIYHTVEDKAAYNGGLFWHSFHYVDAATATHRTYSRSKVTGGGGPSSEHNYTTGLMLHYLLSGDPSSRDAVVGLADWVVQMDDGRKTVFKWLHSGPTGHATASGSFLYHGPGRGAANSLNALLDGHRLAGDRGFLTKAEQLIRRVIHPNDDIAARDLLDTERKWFYTIFLQVLARYLDVKAVAGELDDMYAYARDSLLHYARWMRDHEYPYLDKPELLEFPTESWAAQDIRKSEIFDFAALHAKAADRAAFRERAAFFHEYATRTLGGLPTRTRARPTVIMLSNGFRRRYFAKNTDNTAPAAAATRPYGAPEVFVPQKVVARKRLGWLVIGAGVVLVLLLVLALLLL